MAERRACSVMSRDGAAEGVEVGGRGGDGSRKRAGAPGGAEVGVGPVGDYPALGGDFDGFSGAVGEVEGDGVGLRLEAEGGETVADGPGGSGAVETGAGGEGVADGVKVGIAGKLLEIAEVAEAEPVE